MSIIVVVAAVTLPTIKGLLSGQKVSEAARIVRSYIEAAKSRAVATGRPVALIMDRTSYVGSAGLLQNNMCTRLSMGDVFPPYTGDWAGSKGFLQDLIADGYADAIYIPVAQAASLTAVGGDGLISAGDIIEIGGRRERFVINADPVVVNGNVEIHFNNPPLFQEGAVAMPIAAAGLEFRIYRKPSRSLAGGLSLPRGTCIDLQFSGFGQTGRQFSTDTIQFFAGDSPTYPTGAIDPSFNYNYGPIYLVFSPDGGCSGWYQQSRALGSGPSETREQLGTPSGLIHLLVGATDQVIQAGIADTNVNALSATEEYTVNIMDIGNTWVTVNPYTGGVTTSSVQATSIGGLPSTIPGRVQQARSLATNYLPTQTQ